jgi:REP element-mobilizing transposase RayT
MSEHIHKSHNKSLLLYPFVCLVKFRRTVFTTDVSNTFKEVCLKIELRYEIQFLEIGIDGNYVHFLIQSVPVNSPKK